MIAAIQSYAEGTLVAREQRAGLPNLNKSGRFSPDGIVLVAQMQGESHIDFTDRVLHRVSRELQLGRAMRTIVVSVEASATAQMLASRRRLVAGLAESLDGWPGTELVIQAPANAGPLDRIALFELVESTMQVAPKLPVRLTFTDLKGERAARRNPAERYMRAAVV